MSLDFEARYLDVKWADQNSVLKIDYSAPLEVVEVESTYQVESTTFRKYLPRLGFRCLGRRPLHVPYIFTSEKKKIDLWEIKDPSSGESWWIESAGWDNKRKYHLTELYRTVGTLRVVVQNQYVRIRNNSLDFSVEDLESYLRDFKNELWMMILKKDGYIKGKVENSVPSIFNQSIIQLLGDYTDSIEKITASPTKELIETQSQKPRKSVKPIKRTFMEICMKGNPRFLSSRDYDESLDTPDNRFIHFTLNRVFYLVRQLSVLSGYQVSMHEKVIKSELNRAEDISKDKKIDRSVLESEINYLESEIQLINSKIEENLSQCSQQELSTYRVSLSGHYIGEESCQYFCHHLNGYDFNERYGTYLVVEFPSDLLLPRISGHLHGAEYQVTGVIEKGTRHTRKGVKFYYLNFLKISAVTILSHPLIKELSRLKFRRDELESVNWLVPYTASEKKEIQREKNHIEQKVTALTKMKENLREIGLSLVPLGKRLKACNRFFKSHKISVSNTFPNTMIFVQNPNYALAKSTYTEISKNKGIDGKDFESMLQVDEIGLVNISNLYEKWCLLQIIKTLTEVYQCSIQENWQKMLIKAVLDNQKNIEFSLTSEAAKRKIQLTYEKELGSGKRPDFMLDISSEIKTISEEHVGDERETKVSVNTSERKNRYVIDAKFKDRLNDDTLASLVDEMYSVKNYSEDNSNRVFVLHVSPSPISNRTSPLPWGKHSDYGQLDLHRKGGVYLSPSGKHGGSLDNLQRLIGLFLQDGNYITKVTGENNIEGIEHNLFCIACGNSDHDNLKVKEDFTKAGYSKWEVYCTKCSSFHYINHCRSCQKTLYKNGYYWTYHKTRAEQPFNIMCPSCHTFL